MGREEFENYGIRATAGVTATELAGRYPSQVNGEKEILVDVIQKLQIQPPDCLLEIGCGPGQLLIPLSFLVREATGIDHPEVCSVLEKRFRSENLKVVAGNFIDFEFPDQSFDKILCYSVISTLSASELDGFVVKALSILRPGGQMLIGDVANVDKKSRFLASETGQAFEEDWRKKNLSSTTIDPAALVIDRDRVTITDEVVIRLVGLIRQMGFHCYVLPQPGTLPWGHSREDLLIVRPQ